MKTIIFGVTIIGAVFWGRYDETSADWPTCIDTYGKAPIKVKGQCKNTQGKDLFPNNFKILYEYNNTLRSKKDGC